MSYIENTYSCQGLIKNGNVTIGYRLVDINGSEIIANKEQVITMISQGAIKDLRFTYNNGNYEVRGNGINLTKLPSLNVNDNTVKINGIKMQVSKAATKAKVPNVMVSKEITGRIRKGNSIVGYVVKDINGVERYLNRQDVFNAIDRHEIINADKAKQKDPKTGEMRLTLRGTNGTQIKNLKCYILDGNRVIDPESTSEGVFRATQIKKGGSIINNRTGKRQLFKAGDFIICKADGSLNALSNIELAQNFKLVNGVSKAVCDDYLETVNNYSIELFGAKPMSIKPESVLLWRMISRK